MEYSGRIDIDDILNSPWLEQIVFRETAAIAARAQAYAPIRTGELRTSITFRVEKHSGVKNDRVVGVIETDAHARDGSGYGASEEFGDSTRRGNFFLRRAI